jgi:hypothetical protein
MLDGCSPDLVSGCELIKHWGGTHTLDGCSPVLVSDCELLKHSKGTHTLDGCSPVLSVVVIVNSSNTGEGLTHWMGVHQFLSVVVI